MARVNTTQTGSKKWTEKNHIRAERGECVLGGMIPIRRIEFEIKLLSPQD